MVYERTKENVELRIPMELTLYPMQEKGLDLLFPASKLSEGFSEGHMGCHLRASLGIGGVSIPDHHASPNLFFTSKNY